MKTDVKSVLFSSDGHPDENTLLLALERELTGDEAAQIEQHLGSCWSCRARFDEMQRGILAFVEYREKYYLPSLPTAPGNYNNFQSRLRELAAEDANRWLIFARIRRKFTGFFRFSGQAGWASVVAAATAFVFFYTQVISPPIVSANELLARAEASQSPSAAVAGRGTLRVVHQSIKISSGKQSIVKNFEWKVGEPLRSVHWSDDIEWRNWAGPMTAAAFAEWRDSVPDKTEKVKRVGQLFVLATLAPHSPIVEARISVRTSDFHPVEQYLRFSDQRELMFKELTFEVRDRVSAPRATHSLGDSPGTKSLAAGSTQPSLVTPAELDRAELEVRYLLFKNQWDLGEELNIGRTLGKLTISGTVSSPEREQAIKTALGSLPYLLLLIHAPANGQSNHPAHGLPATGFASVHSRALLEDELSRAFPDRETRLDFVDQCLSASDNSVSHAWALKRLVDRYGPGETHLDPASLQKLREMLSEHLRQLSLDTTKLDVLRKLLPAAETEPPAGVDATWQTNALLLFSQVQRQDHAVADLLAGTQRTEPKLEQAAEEFASTHQRIESLIENLNQVSFISQARR